MAIQSDGTVEAIKSRADILDIVGTRVKLRNAGRNHVGLCPFHEEKTPSFNVSTQHQSFRCFGCGAKGDVFEFLMRSEGLSFVEALRRLAEKYGVPLPARGDRPQESDQQREKKRQLAELLKRVTGWYAEQLTLPGARRARAYLDERGIGPQAVERFQLGYAPGGNGVLKAFGEEGQELLLEAGLVRQSDDAGEGKAESASDRYDFFRQRLMFPILNDQGQVVAFGGRRLDGESKAKYINSPETILFSKRRTIYGLHQVLAGRRPERLILVEGYMDVIALAQFGWDNAVAIMGTSVDRHAAARLFRHTAHGELVLCFDGDEAGQQAARRAVLEMAPAIEQGRVLKLVFLPGGEDPDSLLRKGGRAALETELEKALPLSDYLLAQVPKGGSPEQQSVALQQVVPVFKALPASAYRAILVGRMAKHCGLDERELLPADSEDRRQAGQQPHTSNQPPPQWGDIPEGIPDSFDWPDEPPPEVSRPDRRPSQFAVIELLAMLQRQPEIAEALSVGEELSRPDVGEDVQLAVRLIEELKLKPSWDRAQSRLLGSETAPESWQRYLEQAALLVPGTPLDNLDRAKKTLLHLAGKSSKDQLQTRVKAYLDGQLPKGQERILSRELMARQHRLTREGGELPEQQKQALEQIRRGRKADKDQKDKSAG